MDPNLPAPNGAKTVDPDDVWWAGNFLNLIPTDADRTSFMIDALQFFHSRKIQVFAGYEIVTQDWTALPPLDKPTPAQQADRDTLVADMKRNRALGDAFVKWLETTKDFTAHATNLVAFFDSRGIDIDGISYDLEIDGSNNGMALAAKHAPQIRALFTAVAAELAKKTRYLAFAGVPLETPPGTEQPYSLGLIKDVILRTMSYDSTKERADMMTYALTTVGLHPSHVQIGISTEDPVHTTDPTTVSKECVTYHARRCGLIDWFMTTGNIGLFPTFDKALNPDPGTPRRGTPGQPMQGPLSAARMAVFAAALKKEAEEHRDTTPKDL
jgi:hypothetical protein